MVAEFSVLSLDCMMLFGQEWIVLLCHVFHEANGVTDELAKRGRKHQCSVREYNKYPNFVYIKYVRDILQLGAPCECPMDSACNIAI